MMREYERKFHIDGLLALVLFASFAICILFVLLQGAGIYQRLNERGESAYNQRTAMQYIVMQVHQSDTAESVCLANVGEVQALALSQQINAEVYTTYIYGYEGYLRELFVAEGGAFQPTDGTCIMPAEKVAFSLEDGLLCVNLMQDGQELESYVAVRSVGGGNNEK